MNTRIVEGQELKETQDVPDLMTGTDIGTWQAEYILREVEFERIKYGKPITFNWANSVALTTFGFALNLFAKGFSSLSVISKGEGIALGAGVAISIVLYLIGLLLPNNRKKVMKKIEQHCESAPTKVYTVRGQEK